MKFTCHESNARGACELRPNHSIVERSKNKAKIKLYRVLFLILFSSLLQGCGERGFQSFRIIDAQLNSDKFVIIAERKSGYKDLWMADQHHSGNVTTQTVQFACLFNFGGAEDVLPPMRSTILPRVEDSMYSRWICTSPDVFLEISRMSTNFSRAIYWDIINQKVISQSVISNRDILTHKSPFIVSRNGMGFMANAHQARLLMATNFNGDNRSTLIEFSTNTIQRVRSDIGEPGISFDLQALFWPSLANPGVIYCCNRAGQLLTNKATYLADSMVLELSMENGRFASLNRRSNALTVVDFDDQPYDIPSNGVYAWDASKGTIALLISDFVMGSTKPTESSLTLYRYRSRSVRKIRLNFNGLNEALNFQIRKGAADDPARQK